MGAGIEVTSNEISCQHIPSYLCETCGQVYLSEMSLNDHLVKKHNKGRKRKQRKGFGRQNKGKNKTESCKISRKMWIKSASSRIIRKKPDLVTKRIRRCRSTGSNSPEKTVPVKNIDWTLPQSNIVQGEPLDENSSESVKVEKPSFPENSHKNKEISDLESQIVQRFAEENPTFLLDMINAVEIERRETNVSKFGSLFQNFSQALVQKNLKATDLCFSIASSIARLKNSKTNTMLYSNQEYIFWEYIEDMYKPSCIRDLIGVKGFGLQKETGDLGSQNPADITFNITIPSKNERVRNNKNRPQTMRPGRIQQSIEAIEEEGLNDLNLSLDEKFISSGCEIGMDENNETKINGDQDFFGKATTRKAAAIKKFETVHELIGSLNKELEPSTVIQIHSLLTDYEMGLKEKNIECINNLDKMRSKSRQNKVSIAKEISTIARIDKSVLEIKDLKNKLEESMSARNSSEPNLFLLKDIDKLIDDESETSNHIISEIDDNLAYVNTGSNFWKSKVLNHFKNTIPTDYLGQALGQVTLAACRETFKKFIKGNFQELEYSYSRDEFINIMTTLSQVLSCLDSTLQIFEIGTISFTKDKYINLTVIGCALIKSNESSLFEYAHLHAHEVCDSVLLDLITRMKLFDCRKGFLTVSKDGSPLKIFCLECNHLIDEIWNLMLEIAHELFEKKSLPNKLSDKMKTLKSKLKSENPSRTLNSITEIPLVSSSEIRSTSSDSDTTSIYYSPVLNKVNNINLGDELVKFSERAKDVTTAATLLLRPLASQLLLFSVNSLNGRATKSEREDLPTHYARCGKGTRIKDVRCKTNDK